MITRRLFLKRLSAGLAFAAVAPMAVHALPDTGHPIEFGDGVLEGYLTGSHIPIFVSSCDYLVAIGDRLCPAVKPQS
jgi:hypothetical protein